MKRKDKYPETRSYVYYNANPKNRITGDCTFRAICTALEMRWEDVVLEMAEMSVRTGYAINDPKGIAKYLEEKGWVKHPQPRDTKDNTKYTGARFCDWLSINFKDGEAGNVIANIGGHHIVAIKPTNSGDGINCRYKIHDIWNPSAKCIGNYWTKG